MNRIIAGITWIVKNFFLISISILLVFYLRWFRLAPFVLGDDSDPTFGFIGGMILLGIFVALAFALLHSKHVLLKAILLLANVIFFAINAMYLIIHIPRIEAAAKCNGITYYITYGAPLGDEQWTYRQLTKWMGIFHYESQFFGYAPGRGPSEIVCDEAKSETNIVSLYPRQLRYTDGEHPRTYVYGALAKLKHHLYFISEQWTNPGNRMNDLCCTCNTEIYTLYECNSDYTACNPLPITYTSCYVDSLELRANPTTSEVNLFELDSDNENGKLIFTYGANPRCYIDGCSIRTK